jgi:hypothetical protein
MPGVAGAGAGSSGVSGRFGWLNRPKNSLIAMTPLTCRRTPNEAPHMHVESTTI